MARISIELLSDMCAGSGESLGNVVDTDMCVDAFGLPIIPGRRLKGCLREAAQTLKEIGMITDIDIESLFGNDMDNAGKLTVGDAQPEYADELRAWLKQSRDEDAFKDMTSPGMVSGLYTSVRGQTKMEDGVVDKGSLRFIRVLNHLDPLTAERENLVLYAPVELPEEMKEAFKKCCQALRHMGMDRNRGLGWVKVSYIADEQAVFESHEPGLQAGKADPKAQAPAIKTTPGGDGKVRLSYRVVLDANLVLTGIGGQPTAVPGRAVIGCMASQWLKQSEERNGRDEDFKKLFLSGDVIWSDLTPVIDGKRSEPAPLMLAHLKDRRYSVENKDKQGYDEKAMKSERDALYGNRLTDMRFKDEAKWRKDKQKTVDGHWAVKTDSGWNIASVETDTVYHHRHGETDDDAMLYSHTSVPAGLVYGGTVEVPQAYEEEVKQLIQSARLRFGHSQNAQYARCSLWPAADEAERTDKIAVGAGEPVYVVLASNLLLSVNGRYALNNKEIRAQIVDALNEEAKTVVNEEAKTVEDKYPDNCIDYVQYTTLGGYHAKWGLQKPQVSTVAGGSVFCFVAATKADVPSRLRLGECRQEGMGLCRVLSEAEMRNSLFISKARIENRYRMEDPTAETKAQKALRATLLKRTALETVYESAVALAKKMRNDDTYSNINYGRVQTMIEEAADLDALKTRIEEIKKDDSQAAAMAFYDLACTGGSAETEWKQLLRMTLSLYRRGQKAQGDNKAIGEGMKA